MAILALTAAIVGRVSPAEAHTNAYIVMDAESGQVLRESNADLPSHPASLTKMMTLYLLFDQMEAGRVHLGDQMRVSRHAAVQIPSKLGLSPGQTLTVQDAILGLVTKSANDAAVVVAEFLGGTEEAFAAQMTKKARELGMRQTMFRNASGVPNPGQWSTPHDMAILARALIQKHAREYHYFAIRDFLYDGQDIPTHNHLLGSYEGADGIKTGYINSSGFNLVASAKRGDHRVIGVIFGGRTAGARDRQMVALLDAGFARETGQPVRVETARAEEAEEESASQPATEAEAEDPEVQAVIDAMAARSGEAPPAMPAPESAGDADEGAWAVQLGAFHRSDAAQRVIDSATRRLGDLAGIAHANIEPMNGPHGQLFRARLVGFSQAEAERACRLLRRGHEFCKPIAPDASMASR